ncbi:MAG: hypothetical protein M0P19_14350 [Nevskia sp.]|jgi:predicted regulator of Ras-like GTPase activity (Roadblock/LC7/MglB family)|nr:hypothetical protein [Nevskia sp.]MCK9385438.1 hypothetical protein [Nevskia sp.]
MATLNEGLQELMSIDGALGAMIADASSGMTLGMMGGGINLELAAAGNSEVVKAKLRTIKSLGLQDTIEDMLITLGKQYHIIRPLATKQGLFIYVVLDRARANLALARHKVSEVEKSVDF